MYLKKSVCIFWAKNLKNLDIDYDSFRFVRCQEETLTVYLSNLTEQTGL